MSSSYRVGFTYNIGSYEYCFIVYHHKNGLDSHKSQWRVPLTVEAGLFLNSMVNNFIIETDDEVKSFSFYLSNGKLSPCGVDTQGCDAYICSFLFNKLARVPWHGFPINHMNIKASSFDYSIIDKWVENGLPIKYVKKLKTGKRI